MSFNGLPVEKAFSEVDRNAVILEILNSLELHGAKAIGFVVGDNIGTSFDLLGEWLNRGHQLGTMTFSNQDLHELGYQNFINDISAGDEAIEPMLQGFGQKKRYFRYPFLHYGTDIETKRQIKGYLESKDIITVHATVVVEDYLYNLSLEKLGENADTLAYQALAQEYINHVVDQLEQAEQKSKIVIKRPCRHIIQLGANRLNAAFLNQLLSVLDQLGYKYISVDEAYEDDLYSAPEAYLGFRGVSFLEMLEQSNPDMIPAE